MAHKTRPTPTITLPKDPRGGSSTPHAAHPPRREVSPPRQPLAAPSRRRSPRRGRHTPRPCPAGRRSGRAGLQAIPDVGRRPALPNSRRSQKPTGQRVSVGEAG